jgi:CubicO group peptidase (beta-lactamase class C family)
MLLKIVRTPMHNLLVLLLVSLLLAACGAPSGASPTAQSAAAPPSAIARSAAPSEPTSRALPPSPAATALSQRDYWPTRSWRESTPAAQGLDAEMLARADRAIEAEYPNIYSLLVVRHGYLVFEKYYRDHDRSDEYNVKSITKSVTSALIGIALEQGHLSSLDQRVIEFLPEYATPPIDERKQAITLRHLLTMTSGFAWTEDDIGAWVSSGDWVKYAMNRPLAHQPGEVFTYDTASSHLLSAVISRATTMSEFQFADAQVFQPLGISARIWPADPQGYTFGGSELHLTSRDLAKFGYLYLNNGFWDGAQVVPAAWVQESTTERRSKVGFFGDEGYGYLWWVAEDQGHAAYFALGYGAQYIYVVPDLDLVVVITANTAVAPQAIKDASPLIRSFVIPAIRPDT